MLLFVWRYIGLAVSLGIGSAAYFIAGSARGLPDSWSLALAAGTALLLGLPAWLLTRKQKAPQWAYVYEAIREAERKLKRISRYRFSPRMWRLRPSISRILLAARHILRVVAEEPGRFQRAGQFFNVYVDSVGSILEKYYLLISQPAKDKETRIALRKTERMLQDLAPALEQELSRILAEDVRHLQVELDVLQQNLLPAPPPEHTEGKEITK
nr:5-bromo-4-chloroindolyl phosphate hydrolysis family protein [Ectobacillus ponti]